MDLKKKSVSNFLKHFFIGIFQICLNLIFFLGFFLIIFIFTFSQFFGGFLRSSWIFSKLLMLLLKVTEVTTKEQK